MEPTPTTAGAVLPGDVVIDGTGRLIVLSAETKQIDGRIRFTLQCENGARVNRTMPPSRALTILPLAAARSLEPAS